MYYRQALELQCFLDMAEDPGMHLLLTSFICLTIIKQLISTSLFKNITATKKINKLSMRNFTICFAAILRGYRADSLHYQDQMDFAARSQAVADMKFTYVVSCQVYGAQKKSSDARDRSCYQNVLNLMLM